jgi:outer membrane protein assembly factor BamB
VWVWTAATLALVVVAALLWRGSDAAATESTTADPAGVPVGAPAAAVSEAWSVTGNPMPEDVVESGRVLVGSEHGVRALDPRSGEESWHYTRSNARLCDVEVTNGVAVAVFRTEDRCDEAVALDADTGVRSWTRNVSFAGDVVLESTEAIVLAVAERSLVTLDPNNNNIRWRYEPPERCRILGAEVGDAGVALLQRCSGSPAVQLRLLDGFAGDPRWSRDLPAATDDDVRLLGADRVLGVEVGTDIQLLAGADGAPLRTVPTADDVQMTSVGVAVLLLTDGMLRAYEPASAQRLWEVPARGLPGAPVVHKDGEDGSVLMVPEATGFVPRDALTGDRRGDPSAADDVPAGGQATPIGPIVVHQVGGEVIAYR